MQNLKKRKAKASVVFSRCEMRSGPTSEKKKWQVFKPSFGWTSDRLEELLGVKAEGKGCVTITRFLVLSLLKECS